MVYATPINEYRTNEICPMCKKGRASSDKRYGTLSCPVCVGIGFEYKVDSST